MSNRPTYSVINYNQLRHAEDKSLQKRVCYEITFRVNSLTFFFLHLSMVITLITLTLTLQKQENFFCTDLFIDVTLELLLPLPMLLF